MFAIWDITSIVRDMNPELKRNNQETALKSRNIKKTHRLREVS